jgi:rhodanese-related sulfurtransferase
MLKLIFKVLVIGIASTLLGLFTQRSFVRQSFSGEIILRADTQKIKSMAPSLGVISLAEAKQRLDGGTAVFIDARLAALYQDGHVQGAISFPVRDYEKTRSLEKIANLKATKVVVYCSGKDCTDSSTLAGYLAKEGFLDIEIFEGGWPEWSAAGYPSEKSPAN